MPSGFTAALYDGEQSFKEFVLHCACSRFYDMSALPKKWIANSYYKDRLAEYRAELAKAEKMTMTEAEREANKEYAKAWKEFEKNQRERVGTKDRLLAMRNQVADWAPPTKDHEALKKFMLEQIASTIEHDTKLSEFRLERKTSSDWLCEKIAGLKQDIEYAEQCYAKEVQQTKQRNDWCYALLTSLKDEKKS